MDDGELSIEELEKVNNFANNEAAYEMTMKNKDMFRQEQIAELKEIREQLLAKDQTEEKTNVR